MKSTLHADDQVAIIVPRVTVWSRAANRCDLTIHAGTADRLACLADALNRHREPPHHKTWDASKTLEWLVDQVVRASTD